MSTEQSKRHDVCEQKPVRIRSSVNGRAEKDKCVRQALAARENRLKKKNELQKLEAKVKDLSEANAQLKRQVLPLKNEIVDLEDEVQYLKSVLDNQTGLANLLKGIPVDSIQLSARYKRKRRPSDRDDPARKSSGGICLHVSGNNVSTELCRRCSRRAVS